MKFRHLSSYAVAVCLGVFVVPNARGTIVTYFGEDLQPAATNTNGNINSSLAHPNATAAQTSFLSALSGVSTQTFESYAIGTQLPLVIPFGTSTATITGTSSTSIDNTADEISYGCFAISGTKFLSTDQNFTLTFSTPQAAFGFYGVDVGDYSGQLTLTLAGGGATTLTVPNNVTAAANGSILYEGLIASPGSTFTSITFGDSAPQSDIFAFDDFTIGTSGNVTNPPPNLPEPASAGAVIGIGALLSRRGKKGRR